MRFYEQRSLKTQEKLNATLDNAFNEIAFLLNNFSRKQDGTLAVFWVFKIEDFCAILRFRVNIFWGIKNRNFAISKSQVQRILILYFIYITFKLFYDHTMIALCSFLHQEIWFYLKSKNIIKTIKILRFKHLQICQLEWQFNLLNSFPVYLNKKYHGAFQISWSIYFYYNLLEHSILSLNIKSFLYSIPRNIADL